MNKQLIRFDWAVKKLLRNKANFVVLEGFLSELLFDDIRIEQILESEANQENKDDKFNRVDILTKNSKNELIIVEIQNSFEIDYFHRIVYGSSKAVAENLALGQPYSEIKKVISINIVYFDLGQGEDYIYKGITRFKGLHEQDILTLSERQRSVFLKHHVSEIFPEYYIIKVNQFNNIAKDNLDEWVYFLKNSEVKDEFKAKGLKEAGDVLDIMRLTKEEQYSYSRYQDYLHFKASEMFTIKQEEQARLQESATRAREEGEYKQKIAIASNLISKGMDNDFIADTTGLSISEILELRSK